MCSIVLFQLEQEEEKDDAEVSWGSFSASFTRCPDSVILDPEDQQRINTFSKLNNRVRSLEEKLTLLKVDDYAFCPNLSV